MRQSGFPTAATTMALVVAVTALVGGQASKYARDAKQPIDEEYTKKIREYTTEPFFTSPLMDYLPASRTVPTPMVVLGDVAGAPGRLPYSAEVHEYMRLPQIALLQKFVNKEPPLRIYCTSAVREVVCTITKLTFPEAADMLPKFEWIELAEGPRQSHELTE